MDSTIFWVELLGLVWVLVSLFTASHAILNKRDPRSAVAWVGLILLSPVIGSVLYVLFGINRIKRKAGAIRQIRSQAIERPSQLRVAKAIPSHQLLEVLGQRVSGIDLVDGNAIAPLVNGDQAYPAMLDAIASANRTITLSTYIFDRDTVGKRFIDALAVAHGRGVELRILIDGVGCLYSIPPVIAMLKKRGIPVRSFLPTWLPWQLTFGNLRLHRKLLTIDGELAFSGGMNIRLGHCLALNPSHPVQDIHFMLQGPVVAQIQTVFAHDWHFVSGEWLSGDAWFPPIGPQGSSLARVIPDGPDEDFEKIRSVLLGAITEAKEFLRIVTPYFLPDPALIAALNTAALKGVQVDIVLPQKNNLPWMHWAMMALIGQVLTKGCRVYLSSPPFDHSKLMVVDKKWVFFGSANWDARSLRLNFELNVESYDPILGAKLDAFVSDKIENSIALSLSEVDNKPLPIKLRNGLAKLFVPVL